MKQLFIVLWSVLIINTSHTQVLMHHDALFYLPSSTYYKGGFAVDGYGNTYTSMIEGGAILFPSGSTQGSGEAHLFKHNVNGDLEWSFSAGNNASIADVQIDELNNVYITGYSDYGFWSDSVALADALNFRDFIAKVNADGSYAWAVKTPGIAKIATMGNGHILFAVKNSPTNSTVGYLGDQLTSTLGVPGSLYYGEIDENGQILWYDGLDGPNGPIASLNGMQYNNGKFYIYGYFSGEFDFGTMSLNVSNLCPINSYIYPMDMYLATIDASSHDVVAATTTTKLIIRDMDFDSQNNIYFLMEPFTEGGTCATAGPAPAFLGTNFPLPMGPDAYIVKTDDAMNMVGMYDVGGTVTSSSCAISPGEIHVADDKIFTILSNSYCGGDLYLTPGGMNYGQSNNVFILGLNQDLSYKYHTQIPGYGIGNLQLDGKNDQLAFVAGVPSPNNPTNFYHNFFIDHYKINANRISGTAFKDFNQNASFDTGDQAISGSLIQVTPNPYLVVTNANGTYDAYVDTGTYYLELTNVPNYYTPSPLINSVTFNTSNMTQSVDLRLIPVPGGHDISVDLIPQNQMVVGNTVTHKFIVTNQGTFSEDITINFHPVTYSQPFNGIQITPSMIQNGGDYTATLSNIAPGQSVEYTVAYDVPVQFLSILGESASSYVEVNGLFTDETPSDNTSELTEIAVAPYDPNMKEVNQPHFLDYNQINDLKWFAYTIHFQNEGNYPATKVRVDDVIESDLVLSSLKVLDASHEVRTTIVNNTISFHFDSIMLPVKLTDEEGSKGYVHFKLERSPNLGVGDSIMNNAAIYFDFNPAIITNTVINSVRIDLGTASYNKDHMILAFPNPGISEVIITGIQRSVEKLVVFDVQGHELFSVPCNGEEKAIVKIDQLSSGVYLIQAGDQVIRLLKK